MKGKAGDCVSSLSSGSRDSHQADPEPQFPRRVTQRDWAPRDPSTELIPNPSFTQLCPAALCFSTGPECGLEFPRAGSCLAGTQGTHIYPSINSVYARQGSFLIPLFRKGLVGRES